MKRRAGVLDRLGRAVALGARGDPQAVADARDALVVPALDGHPGPARGPRRQAPLLDVDEMVREHADLPAVDVVLEPVGEVLVQLAAVRDVDDLHPAADAQAGEVELGRAAHEQQLERVALGRRRLGLGMRLGAVGRGGQVGAAGDEHAVEQGQQLARVGEVGRRRGEQQRPTAGARDGVDVRERHERGGLGPAEVRDVLDVAADPDVRRAHAREYLNAPSARARARRTHARARGTTATAAPARAGAGRPARRSPCR